MCLDAGRRRLAVVHARAPGHPSSPVGRGSPRAAGIKVGRESEGGCSVRGWGWQLMRGLGAVWGAGAVVTTKKSWVGVHAAAL